MPVLRALGVVVAVLFVAQLCVAFFLPIYTDEFGFKWNTARAFLDNGRAQFLNIGCRPDPTTPWPLLWMPARWLDALMYEDLTRPTKLRAFGFLYAGIFFAALWLLVRRARGALEGAPSSLTYAFAVSFCALGVVPFLLVMNRPELELAAGIAMLLALVLANRAFPALVSWTLLALLQYYLFTHHPNSILLLPLLVVSWLSLRGPAVAKAAGIAWTGILTVSLFRFYSEFLQCPLDPYLRVVFLMITLTPELLRQFPEYFFFQGAQNLLGSTEFVSNVAFRAGYMADWLPPDPLRAGGVGAAVNAGIHAMWLFALVFPVWRLAPLLRRGAAASAPDPEQRAARWIFVALMASLALTCIAQTNRNDYRSTQVVLMLLLAAVLALILVRTPVRQGIWRVVLGTGFAICIASQATFLAFFAPYAMSVWRTPGPAPAPAQFTSVHHAGYASYRSRVVDAARQCGITEDQPPPHLLLDDLTYPAFWRSRLPYHLVYLTGGWAFGIGDLKTLLEQRNYGGIVAQCDALPWPLRRLTKERHGICCVRRETARTP